MYRTASLLRPARCYAPLPPIFGRNYCIGLFYLHYTPPPPAGRSSRFAVLTAVLHVYACCKCRRVVFVYQAYRKWVLELDFAVSRYGFLRPSSCRRGRWAESGCETTCYVLQHVRGQQLSILQYCHGMSIEGVLVFYRSTEYANSWEGGGGLTARRKRKSSLLRPPPPLFPESRSQKGEA